MDENKILCADNLVIGNDGRALTQKMSFRIGVGACILLCGANGIGKSTLLRTLAGVIPAVSGEIGMRGRPVRVILVPARIPKVPGFSVTDFVATSCYRESVFGCRQQRISALHPARGRSWEACFDYFFVA